MTHTFHLSKFPSMVPFKYPPLILPSFSNLKLTFQRRTLFILSLMVPELERPRVTEIHVRMDCNGCVQKIKKALHGIQGIYDVSIDYPQQKLTVVGWVEPEKIIKAIKKTKKIATVCSHTDTTDSPSQPTEPTPEAAPEATPPPTESPPAEAPPPEEPPKDPPPPENPPPESSSSPPENPEPKDVEEIHVIHHHHPHNQGYGYGSFWNNHPNDHAQWKNYLNDHEVQSARPVYTTHSYNTYKPSPYISEYHQYDEPPPRQTHYNRMEQGIGDYRNSDGNGNGNNITSMFSDENPNACRIV